MSHNEGNNSEPTKDEGFSEDKAELDRIKLRYKFIKWVLGVFVLSLVTLTVNSAINYYYARVEMQRAETERRRAETARLEAESGFLKDFLDNALNDNLLKRKSFAEFMSTVNTNAEMRELWGKYAKVVDQEIERFLHRHTKARLALEDLQKQLNQAQDENTKWRLEREIIIRKTELDNLQNFLSPTIVGERVTQASNSQSKR